VFAAAIAEKPAARFMIRNRIRVVKRHRFDMCGRRRDWTPRSGTSSPSGSSIASSVRT
jgi:hypothetical protein